MNRVRTVWMAIVWPLGSLLAIYLLLDCFQCDITAVTPGIFFKNGKYSIMGRGHATEQMMFNYVAKYNNQISPQKLRYIVKMYIWESLYEGVNHDVAFVQMCHETNFLRFGGEYAQSQNNFCGLTTLNYDITGACFFTIKDGIRAHIQHLKAYGSRKPLKNQCIDPRFDLVQRGIGHNVLDLSGKWKLEKEGSYGKALHRKINVLLSMQLTANNRN